MAAPTQPQDVAARLAATFDSPPGLLGSVQAVSHKNVGKRYIALAFVFFLIGGVEALLLRAQLAVPNNDILGPDLYNELFTLHGSTMMYLFVVPFLEGVANYFLPLMVGTRDLPFPRLNAFNFWTYAFGGTLVYSSFLFAAVPQGGWSAYPPLTLAQFLPGAGMDFWLIGITLAEISALGAAVELIVVVVKQRAPGMSINRLPLFVWAMLVASLMIVFAFAVLLAGSVLLQIDRKFGTHFYDPAGGGDPVLWQHLFWVFGHPEVYIMFLPAAGIVSQVVQTFSRRIVVGYTLVALSIIATGFLSFGLWVHHMFTVGIPLISLGIFAAASYMITIPSGIQVFSWLTTLWRGSPRFATPMLFVIGFIITFVLGGITGVMVATVPFDWQVHDSYFLIAHFHYVLFGGVVFPIFAGIYYWFPKVTGRLLHERLGRWSFWLIFIGFNVTFFPMHFSGLLGMPRRIYTYDSGLGWDGYNLASTVGAFVLAAGIAVSLANFVRSGRRGASAGDNPYDGESLEWATSSPPAPENFRFLPSVASRTPLWDDAHNDDEGAAEVIDALGHQPVTWRATLATTVNDARPDAIVYLPGPTLLPLVAGVGVLLAGIGSLASSWLLVAVGAGIGLFGGYGWLWRGEQQRWRDTQGFTLAGLSVDVTGARATGWWGLVLLLGVLSSFLASLVFSYFFLGLKAEHWPPGATPLPGLAGGLTIAAGLVLIALLLTWATRAAERDGQGKALALLAALLAGGAVVALHVGEYLAAPVPLDANAYGSLFFAFQGFGATLTLIGLGLAAFAFAVSLRFGAGLRLRLLVGNAAMYWWFTVASWLVCFATVYLSPRLA